MWKAILDDGTVVLESDGTPWGTIKRRVKRLGYIHKGTEIMLPEGETEYLRANSASTSIHGGDVTIESKWVGFRTSDNKVFKLRFNEMTGNVSVEVE